MKEKRIIGIIGGMGPGASGYLYNTINSLAVREYDVRKNDEFPETILYSVPVPDFISSQRNKEKTLIMLIDRVQKMNALPISVMGIACNTAHILLPELQRISHAKFISMIDAVAEDVCKKKIKKVGLLATSSTICAGLYQKEFSAKNIACIFPTKNNQHRIDAIIKRILIGKIEQQDKKILTKIADTLIGEGAESIVLGCTELPLIFPTKYSVPVFNSVEILARKLLEDVFEGR